MKLKYGPYSPSRLETATCGYSFYKQYVDPARSRAKYDSVPAARGSVVHEVFEKITQRMCQSPDAVFSPTEVRAWVAEATTKHPAAYPEIAQILEMAQLYINRPPKLLTSDAGIELRLAIKMPEPGKFEECGYDDPDALARGRADIMMVSDDTTFALVYDHKTQPNVEEADTFQMGFYAWVISKLYPFLSEIRTVLHFARYGHYSEPYIWTKEDLAKIEDEVLTRIAIIEGRQSWEPTPNKMCQYCPYLSECPAMAELVEKDEFGSVRVRMNNIKILGSIDKAVKLAGLLNIFEDLVGRIKEELKFHVQSYGPVAIPGKVYDYRTTEGINWDKINKSLRDDAYAIFEKYNVDPRAFMSFNQTASKMIWMCENEALVKELSALFPRKSSSEFRGYKA